MGIQTFMVGITMLGVIAPASSVYAATQSTNNQVNEENNVTVQPVVPATDLLKVLATDQDLPLAAEWIMNPEPPKPEPVQPITHAIQAGETLEGIAKQYRVEWIRLWQKNTDIANPDILAVGKTVTVPFPEEQLAARELPKPIVETPVVAKPQSNKKKTIVNKKAAPKTTTRAVARGSSSGNGYVAGYCTWYAKNRRPDLPNNLGNASTWVSRAAAQGIPTGSTPRAGAIGQRDNHVVYIESVNGDGTVTISEMNYQARYQVTRRTVPASYFRYIY